MKEIEIRWAKRLLDDLTTFFNPEFVERVWVKGLGPEVSSYGEAMCMIFDDDSFEDFISYLLPKINVNKNVIKEYEILLKLLKSFRPSINMPDEEKIAQPEWKAIMAQAAKVLELSRNSPLAAYMPKK